MHLIDRDLLATPIAEYLQHTRTSTQLERLKERLRHTAARASGLTPVERVQAVQPCALLEDGQCSAYSVRPLACRSWNSRDAEACARVLHGGGDDVVALARATVRYSD